MWLVFISENQLTVRQTLFGIQIFEENVSFLSSRMSYLPKKVVTFVAYNYSMFSLIKMAVEYLFSGATVTNLEDVQIT